MILPSHSKPLDRPNVDVLNQDLKLILHSVDEPLSSQALTNSL